MDALDAAREAAWEVQAVQRAVTRYRAAAEGRSLADLAPGRRVMVETAMPVSQAIEKERQAAVAGLGSRGAPQDHWGPLLAFEADVLAVVAVVSAMARNPRTPRGAWAIPLTGFARRVARALRDQADHDRFEAEQKAAERAARKAAGGGLVAEGALLRMWQAAHPQADRKAWARFSKRIGLARSEPWSEEVALKVGSALAGCLAAGAPKWFRLEMLGDGPRTRQALHIALTESAVETMQDVDVRAEVARPLLLPMICPPNPWRYAA